MYEYQKEPALQVRKKILNANLSVFEYTKNDETPKYFWIGDSHTLMFVNYLLHQSTPLYMYNRPATMAYGSYFANMKNVVYENEKMRFPLYYNTYKETLKILNTGDSVVITNFWYFYKLQYLKENKLEDNETSTEIVTAVNRGTLKALATVSQMSVLQSEKAALQEMVA